MEFGGIVAVPPRVLLVPVKCLVDPWIVHLCTMVLANIMGIIQIKFLGAVTT